MGDPIPSFDCTTLNTVDEIPGCAYFEYYCTGGICVGGTSIYSENVAYCDCNGDWIPGIAPQNIVGDCSDISTSGCGQEDSCGVCYGGVSDAQEYTNCDCNGDIVPEDCSNPNTEGCAFLDACGCIGGNTGNDFCNDCPDNFTISPQSTKQETICVPEDFFYYVSTMQAGYIISALTAPPPIILETSNCTNCD
jgi:hypothetical protein